MAHLRGGASAEIDAPLEEVWALVEDVMTAPEWQGGLDRMIALEHDADGRPTLVETENDVMVRRIKACSASAMRGRRACRGRRRRAI